MKFSLRHAGGANTTFWVCYTSNSLYSRRIRTLPSEDDLNVLLNLPLHDTGLHTTNSAAILGDMGNLGKACDPSELHTNDSTSEDPIRESPWAARGYVPVTVWLPPDAVARLSAEPRVVSGQLTLAELCSGALYAEAYIIERVPTAPVPTPLRLVKGEETRK